MATKMSYDEIISTAPKGGVTDPAYDYSQYQGFWVPSFFLEAIISLQEHFRAKPEEIFLCTAPKTGTTWLKALAFAIITRDRFDESTNPLLNTIPHECLPFMEIHLAKDPSYRKPQLPLLATHLPYTSLPKSILESGCKIVYICREPKDTFVSHWHFTNQLNNRYRAPNASQPLARFLSLEKEVALFCEGKFGYGPYWDHVLGYWRASIERPENVLFLKYEEMKENKLFYVKKLADFMGKPFSKEEEIEGVPEKIVEMCSFENLSNLEVNKSGYYEMLQVNNNTFFRKGVTGDWKNLLSEEMKMKIDQTTEQKLQFSGFTF